MEYSVAKLKMDIWGFHWRLESTAKRKRQDPNCYVDIDCNSVIPVWTSQSSDLEECNINANIVSLYKLLLQHFLISVYRLATCSVAQTRNLGFKINSFHCPHAPFLLVTGPFDPTLMFSCLFPLTWWLPLLEFTSLPSPMWQLLSHLPEGLSPPRHVHPLLP